MGRSQVSSGGGNGKAEGSLRGLASEASKEVVGALAARLQLWIPFLVAVALDEFRMAMQPAKSGWQSFLACWPHAQPCPHSCSDPVGGRLGIRVVSKYT